MSSSAVAAFRITLPSAVRPPPAGEFGGPPDPFVAAPPTGAALPPALGEPAAADFGTGLSGAIQTPETRGAALDLGNATGTPAPASVDVAPIAARPSMPATIAAPRV